MGEKYDCKSWDCGHPWSVFPKDFFTKLKRHRRYKWQFWAPLSILLAASIFDTWGFCFPGKSDESPGDTYPLLRLGMVAFFAGVAFLGQSWVTDYQQSVDEAEAAAVKSNKALENAHKAGVQFLSELRGRIDLDLPHDGGGAPQGREQDEHWFIILTKAGGSASDYDYDSKTSFNAVSGRKVTGCDSLGARCCIRISLGGALRVLFISPTARRFKKADVKTIKAKLNDRVISSGVSLLDTLLDDDYRWYISSRRTDEDYKSERV